MSEKNAWILNLKVYDAGQENLKWGYTKLEMWANAQRDGRPAEHRWRPLFNAAKFGWCSLLDCRPVTLPRRESCWNLQGCPKLVKRFQPLVSRSSPYCGDMWRTYCCLTCFFPIVDTCLSCEDIAQQSCAMVPRWRIFGSRPSDHYFRSVCLFVCLFVCAEFFSAVFDLIWIKLGHVLHVRV